MSGLLRASLSVAADLVGAHFKRPRSPTEYVVVGYGIWTQIWLPLLTLRARTWLE
jgi:hypothetical protein